MEREDYVFFGGETMPVKLFKKWIEEYPKTKFVNIYGPTEVTDTFMSYTVSRDLRDQEAIPLGEPRDNHEIIILNDKNELVGDDEKGEQDLQCVITIIRSRLKEYLFRIRLIPIIRRLYIVPGI